MRRRVRLAISAVLALLAAALTFVAARRRSVPSEGARRMGGEDSGFLALELPEQPMNNLYLILLAGGDAAPLTLAELRDRFAARLDVLPALRWRLVPVPLGLDHPVWVDDERFALSDHVVGAQLAAPGVEEELAELCGRLAAEPLDRSRPLWHAVLVDGLAGGGQAIVWRSHHCLMDGAATVTTLARFFADDDALDELEPVRFAPVTSPGTATLALDAAGERLSILARLPGLVLRTWRAWSARTAHERASAVAPPKIPQDVPPCGLNDAFGPLRRITVGELPLADVKAVREAAGVSFTDVALAAVAGGLRSVLHDVGDLPERPLVANCTVSFESPAAAAARQWGNRFSSIPTSLATDLEDPWDRLLAISAVTSVARRSNELVGEQLWEDWFSVLPPMLTTAVVRSHHARRRGDRSVVDANVTVSSVPGPRQPWRLGSFTAERVWLTGPPNNGVGLTVALFTYGDKVLVAVNSIEQSVKDPPALLAAMQGALEELAGEASRRAARGPDSSGN